MDQERFIEEFTRRTELPITPVSKTWILEFLHCLKQQSYEVPTYLADIRVPLLFRKYSNLNKKLQEAAAQVRWKTQVRLWIHILKNLTVEEKINLYQHDPREIEYLFSWAPKLLAEEKDRSVSSLKKVREAIEKQNQECRGGLFPCPECHSKEFVTTSVEQRNRSDEGMQVINMCTRCNKSFRAKS